MRAGSGGRQWAVWQSAEGDCGIFGVGFLIVGCLYRRIVVAEAPNSPSVSDLRRPNDSSLQNRIAHVSNNRTEEEMRAQIEARFEHGTFIPGNTVSALARPKRLRA